MANTSLISRVRTTAGTRRNNSLKHSKTSKKTTRRATFAIWRILFCGAGQTETYTIEDELNTDGGINFLAVFKLGITLNE